MNKMTFTGYRLGIFIEEAQNGRFSALVALENGHFIAEIPFRKGQHTGNSGGEVWRIRLKGTGTESFLKGLAFQHEITDSISLVAVGNDRIIVKGTHRRIDNQRGIY